jgi:uncharacterized phosphosugar-binding protein
MTAGLSYFAAVRERLDAIEAEEPVKIEQAAHWVADALLKERFIFAFGSGHSHVLAEELFYRAGGLARVVPILDERLMVHLSASESTAWERKEGLAETILARYAMQAGDVFFIISNSGRNPVPVEMAMAGQRLGAKVIAISSIAFTKATLSRHSSGKKLLDVADLTIDNHAPVGDAAIQLPNCKEKCGPLSTVTSVFILNAIMVEGAAKATAAGGRPEIWPSTNATENNGADLLAKYQGRIPHL